MTEWYHYILLIVIGFIVGVINTLSGGGSTLTLPILIFLGLPSATANGTNRIAILIQTIFAFLGFRSKGATKNYSPFAWYLALSSTIGAIIGAKIAIDIKDELFNRILAIVMLLIVGSMVISPKKNLDQLTERITGKHALWGSIAFFFIGVYGGFLQAGAGIIMLLALSNINHMTLIRSNVVKAMVMTIYITATLLVFGLNGNLDWGIGLVMAIGQALGGWLTSRWSVNKGDGIVKFFLIAMVLIMAVKLWFF
ncbi:MAG: sulfite exporter TauE/SafE family protein [Flavobacteriaceae bacterium]|jgi:hypothetical protein|nr:sulfite exporter TauE/SafE family protein [Flavobacteriaceae bacterium]